MNIERSNWRDEDLSKRHRTWGREIATVNMDMIASHNMIIDESTNSAYAEVWRKRPVLLIDYKRAHPFKVDWNDSGLACLQFMANQCQCAVIVAFYKPRPWRFNIVPGNAIAERIYKPYETVSELEFVTTLYRLRGLTMPSHIALNLDTYKPKRGE